MNPEAKKAFFDLAPFLEGANTGNMFGYPTVQLGRKPFLFFDKDRGSGAAFKLTGAGRESALSMEGTELFNPGKSPQPMKNWVLIPYSQKEHWMEFAIEAHRLLKLELGP